jgi:hypothetical protein
MHMMLLGESQTYVFRVEHEERVREGYRRRLANQARKAAKAEAQSKRSRGMLPRLANALGLF